MTALGRISVMGIKADDVPPISRRNELAVLNTLEACCERSLNAFSASIEEDDKSGIL